MSGSFFFEVHCLCLTVLSFELFNPCLANFSFELYCLCSAFLSRVILSFSGDLSVSSYFVL